MPQPFDVEGPAGTPVWSVLSDGTTRQIGGMEMRAGAPAHATDQGYVQLYSPDGTSLATQDPTGVVRAAGAPQFATAPQDQSTTSAAQVASTYLVLPVAAGATYIMRAAIIAQNTVGNFVPSWTGPAGATMKWCDTTASLDYQSTLGGTANVFGANAGTRMIFLEGKLKTSTTPGSLTFTFSASAGTSTVFTDSYLTLNRVG